MVVSIIQYDGEWYDDLPHGIGTMVYPLSDRATGMGGGSYEGAWVNGQRWGEGKRVYLSGDVYTGRYIKEEMLCVRNIRHHSTNN